MRFTHEALAHEEALATLCRLPFFCARDVMQRVRVASTIPAMFDAAAVDCASAAPFARWSFQSYRDCSLPWSAHRCDAGSVFSLAQAFVVPGRTRRTIDRAPARVSCSKILTTISNSADDISNLCCKLSTPLSSAAHQAALGFELVDATDDGHDPAQSRLS
ncbi:hypothetical protein MTO96_011585 [Rhipicephalus appendiculatus]